MSRSNIVLVIVLAVVGGSWFALRDRESEKSSGPAPKMFPDFNPERVDRIEMEGGWEKTSWAFVRHSSDWTLDSAGGYPVKAETPRKFIDAIRNLRRDARVGASKELQKRTRTDDSGRLVRLKLAPKNKGAPAAPVALVVGKTPKNSSQTFFVRRQDEQDVYRTRTLLPKDLENEPRIAASPWDTGAGGFRWSDYTRQISDWIDTTIWRLGDAETQEIMLSRAGQYEITLKRKGDDEWELTEAGKKETVPADVDNTSAISDDLRYLNLTDVLGKYEDVRETYGLDQPEITVVLTLKEKIKKKEEPAGKKDDSKKDEGEDDDKKEKDKKKKEPEFKIVKRMLEVGKKIERPESFDDETGKVRKESYYAVHIGGVFEDPEMEQRSKYVFLVDAVSLRGLRKELSEFKQKPAEKEQKEGEAKKDEAKKDEAKKDAAKKDEAKKVEPKKVEPKKDATKTDGAKKDAAKPAEPKKDETKKAGAPKDEGATSTPGEPKKTGG